MSELRVCRNCGHQLEEVGPGKFKCPACSSIFEDGISTDEEIVLLTNASFKLRDGDFDEADKAYRSIIAKFPHSYEAYFGRALCKHGITFVDDITKGKTVPTCYITDIGSFVEDANYKKAIQFAPDEVKKQYENQAKLIENIIDEWKEKASKQSYDVFISYKDKDENGERTPDSYVAEEIYTYLTQQGYKVFFSRQVLREFVSERYEPYIFNAINVAPVMIVYGQKSEYMESTWVRNEWSRFIKKIQVGEKDKAGLIVAFEKMNGGDLPSEFRNIQCMDSSERTFFPDLVKHIQFAIDKSRKPTNSITAAQTEYGKVGKKQKQMNYQEVRTFEIGTGVVEKVTETDEFIWQSAQKFFAHNLPDKALKDVERFLENNEYHYGANELKLLIQSKCASIESYISSIKTKEQAEKVKYLITLCDKDQALHLIDCLLDLFKTLKHNNDELMFDIFHLLLDLDFPKNKDMRKQMVNYLTHPPVKFSNRFDDYIKYIDNSDIDFHIKSRLDLIEFDLINKRDDIDSFKYIQEVKDIEEGNVRNLRYELFATLDISPSFSDNVPTLLKSDKTKILEKLVGIFKYCENKKEITNLIFEILEPLVGYITFDISPAELKSLHSLYLDLIKYIPEDQKSEMAKALEIMVNKLYEKQLFELCLYYCNILLNYTDDRNAVIYLILLCKIECPNHNNNEEARFCKIEADTIDEYKVLFNTEYEERIFKITAQQQEYLGLGNKVSSKNDDTKAKIKAIKKTNVYKDEKKTGFGFFVKWFFRNPFAIFLIILAGIGLFIAFKQSAVSTPDGFVSTILPLLLIPLMLTIFFMFWIYDGGSISEFFELLLGYAVFSGIVMAIILIPFYITKSETYVYILNSAILCIMLATIVNKFKPVHYIEIKESKEKSAKMLKINKLKEEKRAEVNKVQSEHSMGSKINKEKEARRNKYRSVLGEDRK